MIIREHYLEQLRPFVDSDLIKIITGIRRCGKSVIMQQLEEELRSQGKATLSLNFEDRAVSLRIPTVDALIDYVGQRLGDRKLYVFLDEIQTLEGWNLACKTLRLKNLSLFVTGSNSRLLSGEFTRELSGRYVSFRVRPFVFREMSAYAAELKRDCSVADFLIWGGFPKTAEFVDPQAVRRYLCDLDDTIVLNDIMNRYAVRKSEIFKRLVNFVLISNSRIFSASSVQKFLKGQGFPCSLNTVMKYLGYLEEAYVISPIRQYSTKNRRELKYFQKLYDEDVAFNSIRQPGNRFDLTHNLENVVYNELVFRGYELAVFVKDDLEIDFLAKKDGKRHLVQVAYSIAEDETYECEFRLFNRLDNSMKKTIITNDDADFSTSTVTHLKLRDFLMGAEL